eukprot:CAMPEP_0175905828 /NCGR_PEP_ID=MMETSP0108-20121206/5223_1 /TAXON_ID=195067 ORGANISM="Goniomonas pacifica, Strain CCMP1869" /NCGR_SAMPLE_ID=MMETSP0108 /ASSEMBLY_ACC=CAM_ASM_000204 /LENGTH=68 /DNA_ID=CAMNT_0017227743 /DNA_START=414 /DNA_END=620 /DNA_ORIENTATION=-
MSHPTVQEMQFRDETNVNIPTHVLLNMDPDAALTVDHRHTDCANHFFLKFLEYRERTVFITNVRDLKI